jgi:hypothetical protein
MEKNMAPSLLDMTSTPMATTTTTTTAVTTPKKKRRKRDKRRDPEIQLQVTDSSDVVRCYVCQHEYTPKRWRNGDVRTIYCGGLCRQRRYYADNVMITGRQFIEYKTLKEKYSPDKTFGS